jgi:hypothetical protein
VLTPGQDVFFIFNHSWQQNPLDRWESYMTSARAKFQYTFRF